MMNCVIGALLIDPDQVTSYTGEYIVEFPVGTRVLTADWLNGGLALWVAVPRRLPGEEVKLFKRRFWIVPGLRDIELHDAATYLSTLFIDDQDWHVFIDYSGLEVHRAPDAAYPMH